MINISSHYFGSIEYNENIKEIRIMGVYDYHRNFYKALEDAKNLEEANLIFDRYIQALFELSNKIKGKNVGNLYKVLMGWMFNANGFEGAVLKGWVESRFGIIPTFHKRKITELESESYYEYLTEKMSLKVNKNAMYSQLDLLYHYTQSIIKRFFPEYIPYLTLYRGIYDLEEYVIIKEICKKQSIIMHNNLSSFTIEKNIAEQFGNKILTIDVPYTKVLFFSKETPLHHFSGEQEYLVIGGNFLTGVI
jgi:NAD+--dinitrogen-reductase ADP-D-ribosyltransferase